MREFKTVRITGGPVGQGVRITDEETDRPIPGVVGAQISIRPDEVVQATLTIDLARVDLGRVVASYSVLDPRTGQEREIRSITFADGEELIFPAG